jgi:hypothetical protein
MDQRVKGRELTCVCVIDDCLAAQKSAKVTDFSQANNVVASTNIGPDPQFPDFDLICDA